MKNFISDARLFNKFSQAELVGLYATYIDESLYAKNEASQETTKKKKSSTKKGITSIYSSLV